MKAICDVKIDLDKELDEEFVVTDIFCEGATFVEIVAQAVKQTQCIFGPLDRDPKITLSISVAIQEV